MHLKVLIVPAIICLCLSAQDDLPLGLARAQGVSLEEIHSLQARLAATSATPNQKAYSEALLGYCTVNRLREKDPKQAESILEGTLKVLGNRKDAESLALLGACTGQKMGFSPMMSMFLNPRALGLFKEALKLDPNNPRVLFFYGVHILHTPAFIGGGPEKAMPILLAAVKAAQAEVAPKDSWAPRWGRVESLCWLAIAQAKVGLIPEAEATLLKAKAVDPSHGFVDYAARRVQVSKTKKS